MQSLADVACSTGVVGHGLWLVIARQYLSCASVPSRGIFFRHFYQIITKSAGKDFRNGSVVPFEVMWLVSGS